jgi:O-antigen ligase
MNRETNRMSPVAGKVEARAPGAIGAQEKAGWRFYLVLIALLLEFGRPQDLIPGLKMIPLPSMVDVLIGLSVLFAGKVSLATTQTKLWGGLLSLMALHVPFATNNYWALMVFKDMVLYFFLYLGITAYIDSTEKMRKLVAVWVGIHLVLAILGMQSAGQGVGGWLGDENDFCMEMNAAVPFAYFMLLGLKHKPSKVFYFTLLCIFIMTAMITLSRGGFIGLAAVGTYCWLKSSQKGRAVVLAGIVIIFMLIFAPEQYWEEMQTSTSDQTMTTGTGAERLYTWGIGWDMFLGNPLVGVGQGNFPWNFNEFQGGERFNTRSLAGRAAHSMYFTLLPELGLMGAGMFFMMILSNYKTAGRVRFGAKRVTIAVPKDGKKENNIAFNVALSGALEAAMVGYLVSSVFIATLYYPTIWILTGFVVALGKTATREFAQDVAKMPHHSVPRVSVRPILPNPRIRPRPTG